MFINIHVDLDAIQKSLSPKDLHVKQYLQVLYCGRVQAANAPWYTAAEGLLYKPWSLVFPTCTARCLHQKL